MALPPSPMPGGGPPMGGAPPGGPPGAPPGAGPPGPPGGTGPAAIGGMMGGNAHQGMAKVKTAVHLLQESVAGLPMGSPLHQKVLKFVAEISKEFGQQQDEKSDVQQQIAGMARQGPNPMAQAAMAKMAPPQLGPGGPPPGGGGPPPMGA